MSHPVRLTGLAAALACTLALPLLTAAPAAAAPSRHDGGTLFTSVRNCESVAWGTPYYEAGAGVVASVIYDDQDLPRVGEVFYAVVEFAAVGNPYPCLDQAIRPDIVMPDGLSLAISEAHPVRCITWDYRGSGAPVDSPETALCPRTAQPPQEGGTHAFGTSSGEMWKVPTGIGYEIRIPVVASRPGYTSVDFRVRIVDGNDNPLLTPVSGLVDVRAGGTSEPEPGDEATVGTSVAPTVRLARTKGTVPAWVTTSPADADVKLTVVIRRSGRWVPVGSLRYSDAASDTTRVRVPVAKRWRHELKGKQVRARLHSVASAGAGNTARATEPFTLKG